MEITGIISTILLAICGLPLAIKSFRSGNSDSVDSYFLILWTLGEIFGFIYLFNLGERILLWNYILNLGLLSVVIYFKLKPRKK